jgi:biotin synthase-like enzyme
MNNETCEYCSFFEYGWCDYHNKTRNEDNEICDDAKEGFSARIVES